MIKKIKCPKCNGKIKGEITHFAGDPFLTYIAYCEKCNYHIGESEWEECNE